jgi:hydroxymethylpyrimidine/phosphomethylpyrimidine kinase
MSGSRPPVALTIAGSDPSGGAGLQADLAAFAAAGVLGASVVTALTVQSTRGVRAVHPVAPELVAAQLDCLLEDLPAGALRAIKLGMLATAVVVGVVAARLSSGPASELPVVLDPVLAATRGPALLDEGGLAALRAKLLPRADVLTPNLEEAALLLELRVGEVLSAPEAACRALAGLGPRAVLLKGGHAGGFHSEDLLFCDGELVRLPAERVDTTNDHGTGCVLAAALAAHLAQGRDLVAAARAAKELVTRGLRGAREWDFGPGAGPLDLRP